MKASRFLWLGLIGMTTAAFAAWSIRSPGYMDADYYFATATQLSQGHGFSEPFLWNYLDDPQGLPHPSHLYWMPLTSVLAAGSMILFGSGFRAAQIPSVLMTAALPMLTASTTYRLTKDSQWSWRSGLLAAFSGFFLPFFVTTDAFSLYAVLGSAALWSMALAAQRRRELPWMLSGALVGLCNLTRADGLLLLAPGVMAVISSGHRRKRALLSMLLGYLVIMSPWWMRNFAVAGSPMGQGSARSLWLLQYDELFSYPAGKLTFSRWWEAGFFVHLADWLEALGVNLQRLIAENGLVFLAPFMALGAVRLWREKLEVRLAIAYLLLLLAVMTLIFPFIGPRGAFFHSSAAAMPVLWALAVPGLHRAIHWLGRRRGWNLPQAQLVLGSGAILLAGALTLGLLWRRVLKPDGGGASWAAAAEANEAIGERLAALDRAHGAVATNNPPGFFLATGHPSVVIPFGGPEVLREVTERYEVDWLVLDANHPGGLEPLYQDPDSLDWMELRVELRDTQGRAIWLFEVYPETDR